MTVSIATQKAHLKLLIKCAEDIIKDSRLDWEQKYDCIFDLKIWQTIDKYGYSFGWFDPDTSYEEDVTAYVKALREFRDDVISNTDDEVREKTNELVKIILTNMGLEVRDIHKNTIEDIVERTIDDLKENIVWGMDSA